MLVLKLTDANRRAHGDFQWPESGPVECPDWNPEPECGGGLHGWLNGEGRYRHATNEGQWLVVETDSVVSLDGGDKVKFKSGTVVFCGTRVDAVRYLIDRGALTDKSNPAWCTLTPAQCVEVAMRAADRAVRKYAPKMLRARGMVEVAERLEALPQIKDRASALAGKSADADADAYADAYAYAAAAADYADAYAYAADAAADYAAAAGAADAAAAYAAAAADSAYYAYYAAADADADYAAEREAVRLDKLELLGLHVTNAGV